MVQLLQAYWKGGLVGRFAVSLFRAVLNHRSWHVIVDRKSSLEEIFLDPGFFWSWERFEDRWLNYFGYVEEDLEHTVVDVVANYNSLVCDDLRRFMEDTQFIKVCGVHTLIRVMQALARRLRDFPSGVTT